MKKALMLRNAGAMIIAATMVMSVAVSAEHGKGHGRGGDKIERMVKHLELTEAQQAQIKAIREGFKTANASTMQEIKTLHEQLKQQMKNKDREGAKATHEQIKAKKESMKPARERMMTQIRGVLNATQQAKLDEMMSRRKDHHKGKRGDRKELRREKRQDGVQKNGTLK